MKAGHHLPKLETRKSQKIIISLWMEGTDDGVLKHRYMRHTTTLSAQTLRYRGRS